MTSNQLQRSLGLYLVVFYGLGNILGAGIYVLVGKVAGVAGMYTPLAFVVACFVASFTALAYAELTAKFPVSAGEAVYVHQGFGSKHLALFIGLMVAISAAVSSATIARGFVGYLQVFIDIPAWLAICLLLITLTSIAALGVKHAVGVAAVLTLVEITGLLLVIIVGADSFTTIPQRLPELIPDFSATTIIAIMAGGFLAFYAFLGFEDMVNVAEEVKNPERNLTMGIILSLIIATLFYALIALVAVLNVPPKQLAMSDAPLALVY
ncbi:MAG: amino acid permease, partial [Gammaproteobacteria bacterium]|nr:amino acid permease [Gammaproteobacteria bacterium]